MRRFFCEVPSCERKIFCERLEEVAARGFFLASDERVRHAEGQSSDPPEHRGGPCQVLGPSCQTPKR